MHAIQVDFECLHTMWRKLNFIPMDANKKKSRAQCDVQRYMYVALSSARTRKTLVHLPPVPYIQKAPQKNIA